MKKLVLLTCLVLALGFLSNTASAVDPNLVGHWTFDDGTADDSSGNNNDGTLVLGDTNSTIAIVYDAVRGSNVVDINNPSFNSPFSVVDDGSYVNCGNDVSLDITGEITMSAWFTGDSVYWCETILMAKEWSYGFLTYGCNGDASGMTTIIDYPDHNPYWNANTYDVIGNGWHYFAATYDSATGDQTSYIDGTFVNTANYNTGLPDPIAVVPGDFYIGGREGGWAAKRWDGRVDDVRLYDRLLSMGEIREVGGYLGAWDPTPIDTALFVSNALASITWQNGPSTVDNKVYLGTDESLVDARDASVDKGTVVGTSYSGAPMGALTNGVNYYWAIDANYVTGVASGDTWDFFVGPPPANPNLKGQWTFDDGTADDSSGWFNHGTLYQGPTDSNTSVAIVYDAVRGSNVVDVENVPSTETSYDWAYVNCGSKPSLDITAAITFMGWFNAESFTWFEQTLMGKDDVYKILRWGTTCGVTCRFDGMDNYWMNPASDCIDDGNWHHISLNYDSVTGIRQIHIDGDLSVSSTHDYDAPGTLPLPHLLQTSSAPLQIGANVGNKQERAFDGMIDDVRVYDVVLTIGEVREAAENYKAYNPTPDNGEIDVEPALAALSWDASLSAVDHKVYVGTSQALVDARDASVDKGTVVGSSYSGAPIGSMQLGIPYFWAVDTNTGTGPPVPGDTWGFDMVAGEAAAPSPFDGSKYIRTSRQLSWQAGFAAAESVVYVGTDETLVTNGDASVYETTVTAPGPCVANPTLVVGTVYYWKVDSNTGTQLSPGYVWEFETLAAAVDPNLRGYWPLDEEFGGATVTWDITGNENHGTFVDGTQACSIGIVVDPVRGNVLDCNKPGTEDPGVKVDCGTDASLDITDEITLMAWTKPHSITYGEQIFITKGWEYGLLVYGSTQGMTSILWGLSPYWSSPATSGITDGQWHHVALAYDAVTGIREVSIDGFVESGPSAAGVDLPAYIGTNTESFAIGGKGEGQGFRYWDGLIDEVKLFDRRLAQHEIRAEAANCDSPCVGDLDANSVINLDDLNQLIGDLTMAKIRSGLWVINPGDPEWNNCSDMDLDSLITLADLNRMIGNMTWRRIFFGQWQYPCGAFNP